MVLGMLPMTVFAQDPPAAGPEIQIDETGAAPAATLANADNLTYTGKAIDIAVKVKTSEGSGEFVEDTNKKYTVAVTQNNKTAPFKDAGTYTIKVTYKATDDATVPTAVKFGAEDTSPDTVTLTISPMTVKVESFTVAEQKPYDAKADATVTGITFKDAKGGDVAGLSFVPYAKYAEDQTLAANQVTATAQYVNAEGTESSDVTAQDAENNVKLTAVTFGTSSNYTLAENDETYKEKTATAKITAISLPYVPKLDGKQTGTVTLNAGDTDNLTAEFVLAYPENLSENYTDEVKAGDNRNFTVSEISEGAKVTAAYVADGKKVTVTITAETPVTEENKPVQFTLTAAPETADSKPANFTKWEMVFSVNVIKKTPVTVAFTEATTTALAAAKFGSEPIALAAEVKNKSDETVNDAKVMFRVTDKDGKNTDIAEVRPVQPAQSGDPITYQLKINKVGTVKVIAFLSSDTTGYAAADAVQEVNITTLELTPTVKIKDTKEITKVYDGTAALPDGALDNIEVTFKDGTGDDAEEVKLTKGTDYTVEAVYAAATVNEKATINVTVKLSDTAKTKYSLTNESKTVIGKITAATPTLTWKAATKSVEYTGSSVTITDAVTVTGVGKETPGGAVTYTYSATADGEYKSEAPTNAGTYYVKASIAANGNYAAAETKQPMTLTITKKAIESVTIKAPTAGTAIAVGNQLTLTVAPAGATVTYEWTGAAETKDAATYTVADGDTTIKVKVTGTGNYSGTAEAQVEVGKIALGDATVTATGVTYTGEEQTAVITVKIGEGEALTLDKDYTVSGDNKGTNAGTYTFTVTGKGDYSGTATGTFTIAPASIESATVETKANQTFTYTGEEQTVEVTVKLSDKTLVEGTDYTVTGNIVTNAGDDQNITVSVTGKGNYTGTASDTAITVSVAKATPTVDKTSVTVTPPSASAAGGTATVTVTTNGNVSATSADEAIATATVKDKTVTITGVKAGTTKITVKAEEGTNYEAKDFEVSITVSAGGGGGGFVGGGGGGTTTTPTTPSTSGDTTSVSTGSNGVVDNKTADALVEQVKENNSANAAIKADGGSAQIPASAMTNLAGTNASLTVETPAADVTIPNGSLAELGGASGTVTVKATAEAGNSITVSVEKNGQAVTSLSEPMKVTTKVDASGASSSAGMVAVKVNADGTETVLPKSTLSGDEMTVLLDGSATVKFVDNSKDFDDVSGHWADNSGAIDFVSSHGLFQGVSTTSFGPETKMSRAMMVTVLHRLESTPDASGVSFDDVPGDAYYADAASWAADLGIAKGTDKGFEGGNNISREMMVTMLYRYAQKLAPNAGRMGSYAGMGGAGQVSSWASDAMNWAVGSGIIQGDGSGLRPGDFTSRAEMATVIQRFVNLITK